MSAQHTPGPWKVCQWNDGKSYTVWRELHSTNGEPVKIERMLNASGNRKRFRSEKAAQDAITKATGSAPATKRQFTVYRNGKPHGYVRAWTCADAVRIVAENNFRGATTGLTAKTGRRAAIAKATTPQPPKG